MPPLILQFFCRYKFWLTNGEPWDFFHYHFSADEFYILPILMVGRTHDDSTSSFLTKGDKSFSLTHWTGLWSLQSDPPDTYLQKCDPGWKYRIMFETSSHSSVIVRREVRTISKNFHSQLRSRQLLHTTFKIFWTSVLLQVRVCLSFYPFISYTVYLSVN